MYAEEVSETIRRRDSHLAVIVSPELSKLPPAPRRVQISQECVPTLPTTSPTARIAPQESFPIELEARWTSAVLLGKSGTFRTVRAVRLANTRVQALLHLVKTVRIFIRHLRRGPQLSATAM